MIPKEISIVRDWLEEGILTVTARKASTVLHCNHHSLNVAAQKGTLKIGHTFVGNRLKISTISLLMFLEGGGRLYVGQHEEKPLVDHWRQELFDARYNGYPKPEEPETPQKALWLK